MAPHSAPVTLVRSAASPAVPASERGDRAFVTASDYDVTGILTGVEPCASSYWWIAEMHAPVDRTAMAIEGMPPVVSTAATDTGLGPRHQAARRSDRRASTAA